MSDALGNLDPLQREELARRASALYVKSPAQARERRCLICDQLFAEQGQYNLAEHYKAAHAAELLAMPAEKLASAPVPPAATGGEGGAC